MRITCPHCEFAKEIDAELIPTNVVRITCPACRQPFALAESVAPETTPEATASIKTVETVHADTAHEHTDQDGESVATEAGQSSYESAKPACRVPVEYASISTRYAALLIDTMLILIMVMILRTGLTMLGNGIQLEGIIILNLAFALFALVLGFAYHALFIGVCGQTPGKRLMRIRVISTDQTPLSWAQAMLREVLGKTLSSTLLLGYIMALFHPQHLTAHDKIADTCVVKFASKLPLD